MNVGASLPEAGKSHSLAFLLGSQEAALNIPNTESVKEQLGPPSSRLRHGERTLLPQPETAFYRGFLRKPTPGEGPRWDYISFSVFYCHAPLFFFSKTAKKHTQTTKLAARGGCSVWTQGSGYQFRNCPTTANVGSEPRVFSHDNTELIRKKKQ